LRKNAALVSVNLISIAVELEYISTADIHPALRVKAATLFSALREAVSRMSTLVLTLKSEEKLLAATQVKRIKKLTALIKNFPLPEGERQTEAIQKIVMLTGRTTKLLESAISRVEQLGNDVPVYRSYSMIKTMFVLQPKKIASNVRTLFNFNSLAIRFAFRSAITAAIALFVGVFFKIDHGYWLPFSLMIVIQPYFGATLKKAIDRITGTILGGIAGGLLVLVPTDLHIKEALLFITFVVMVYYVRKNYAIAAFAVTLNLVLLFNIDQTFSYQLLLIRALSTVGGSLLAVVAGFALLPNWDKKWLPRHLAEAVYANYTYFNGTFYSNINNWIKNKRRVESANSNVFDSFNRYMEEPGSSKSDVFYDVITCNIRVTRDLNNINLEQEEKSNVESSPAPEQLALVAECNQLFLDIIGVMRQINAHVPAPKPAELQTGVFQFKLNHFQLISLQKLRLELQHMKEDIVHLAEVSIENEAAG
jgi:uncharacterized membrane protein YccC